MTEWHWAWQLAVPPERREVVMGPHRADIVTASGGVVEIQHSPIPVEVIAAREEFYGPQMAWIFDATKADIARSGVRVSVHGVCGCPRGACTKFWGPGRCRDTRGDSAGKIKGEQPFRWNHPRRSVRACRQLLLLDLGGGQVLRVTQFASGVVLQGVLLTRRSVESWLRDGSRWERIR